MSGSATVAGLERRLYYRLWRFGIHKTPEVYFNMLRDQGGACAICHREETATRRDGSKLPLGIDHNHSTGKIRALLCTSCNCMVGWVEKNGVDPSAITGYLEKHRSV